MFRYYLGVAVIMLLMAAFSFVLASHPAPLVTIFVGLAAGFVAVAYVTSGKESRW
ncbi:MAG: hypothetical protein JWN30_643 [Bacilli bacterium]|nr:hypothetical protein [Bacilli bacterium]